MALSRMPALSTFQTMQSTLAFPATQRHSPGHESSRCQIPMLAICHTLTTGPRLLDPPLRELYRVSLSK